tara:strand:- start:11 stop:511 length:501 start_codon:yes stop_codon:yes gene_type:complete
MNKVLLFILVCAILYYGLKEFMIMKSNKSDIDFTYGDDSMISESGFTDSQIGVTPDEVAGYVKGVANIIKTQTGICADVTQTTSMKVLDNKAEKKRLVKCQFMFVTTQTNFPVGFAVQAVILDGNVIKATTQTLEDTSPIKPYTGQYGSEFVTYDEIFPKNIQLAL